MAIIFDTNIIINFERNPNSIIPKLEQRLDEEFFISVITVSELMSGIWRAKEKSIKNRRSAFVETILDEFIVLNIDLQTAKIHSQIWSDLINKGLKPQYHDSWIAATCISNGYGLVTENIKDYKNFPGLKLETWF